MLITGLALWLSIGFILSFLFIIPAYSHGGGLDAYGCHHNRKVWWLSLSSRAARRSVLCVAGRDAEENSAEKTIPTKDNPPPKK
jgi:hypothetical protein